MRNKANKTTDTKKERAKEIIIPIAIILVILLFFCATFLIMIRNSPQPVTLNYDTIEGIKEYKEAEIVLKDEQKIYAFDFPNATVKKCIVFGFKTGGTLSKKECSIETIYVEYVSVKDSNAKITLDGQVKFNWGSNVKDYNLILQDKSGDVDYFVYSYIQEEQETICAYYDMCGMTYRISVVTLGITKEEITNDVKTVIQSARIVLG